jgi:hypothetical protein
MEMPKPTAAHLKLRILVGDWIGEEKLQPSPWDPKGGTARGHVHNRSGLDGFAVIQDYEQERGGKVTFQGHGLFTWNPQEQNYALYWFDSMGLAPNVFKGNFNGQVLTLWTMSSQGHSRAVFDFSQAGAYAYRMEVSPDGKQWHLFMSGTYQRKDHR